MRWRRKQYRNGERRERPHLRNIKYEAVKESAGKLIDAGAAAVGGLIGAQAARAGLPLDPVAGAALGGALGAGGKAVVVGALDMLKGRKSQQSANGGDSRGSPTDDGGAPFVSSHTQQVLDRGIGIGAVISGIGGLMSQLEKAEADLALTMQRMHTSHERMTALLAGGRGDKMARPLLVAAREHVKDAHSIVIHAKQNLRNYLSSL